MIFLARSDLAALVDPNVFHLICSVIGLSMNLSFSSRIGGKFICLAAVDMPSLGKNYPFWSNYKLWLIDYISSKIRLDIF
jgi:hypothetical protein